MGRLPYGEVDSEAEEDGWEEAFGDLHSFFHPSVSLDGQSWIFGGGGGQESWSSSDADRKTFLHSKLRKGQGAIAAVLAFYNLCFLRAGGGEDAGEDKGG